MSNRISSALAVLSVVVCALFGAGCSAAEGDEPSAETQAAAIRGGCRYDCPRCRPGEICPRIACRLICPPGASPCGNTVCRHDQVCCNASCGICTDVGGVCTQQVCGSELPPPPPAPGACATDADCRTFSDYCTGCDCRALSSTDADPTCDGPGVRCFADPCGTVAAYCDTTTHTCALR